MAILCIKRTRFSYNFDRVWLSRNRFVQCNARMRIQIRAPSPSNHRTFMNAFSAHVNQSSKTQRAHKLQYITAWSRHNFRFIIPLMHTRAHIAIQAGTQSATEQRNTTNGRILNNSREGEMGKGGVSRWSSIYPQPKASSLFSGCLFGFQLITIWFFSHFRIFTASQMCL